MVRLGFGACALALLAGCRASPPPSAPPLPNVVLLSIDTLRADHLGCYGYTVATSPEIDRLASESTLYEEAIAPAPWTLPSHAAMLTGVHPYKLGIFGDQDAIPARTPALAQALQAAGYQTAGFVDSGPRGFVGGERGFARGFGTWAHAPFAGSGLPYDTRATVREADAWLERRDARKPFFLFLHTKSVHAGPDDGHHEAPYFKPRRYMKPFLPPDGRLRYSWTDGKDAEGVRYLRELNERIERGAVAPPALSPDQVRELVGMYDAGISYVDEQVAELRAVLARRGLAGSTVLILTSDHGEAFLEHRFVLHREVYEPLLHIPLIVHDPRVAGARRLRGIVHLADVPATIRRLAGLPDAAGTDGAPLPAQDARGVRPTFAFYRYGAAEAYAVRDERFKLIRQRQGARQPFAEEAYDLARDPGETSPLPADDARRRALRMQLEESLRQAGPSARIQMNAKSIEELRALGYAQ